MVICTTYDTKSGYSGPLFSAFDLEHAKRLFMCSLREDSPSVLYPSDYELRIIGTFDEVRVQIHSYDLTEDNDYQIIPISEFMPDKYKKYCLDGTFDNQK